MCRLHTGDCWVIEMRWGMGKGGREGRRDNSFVAATTTHSCCRLCKIVFHDVSNKLLSRSINTHFEWIRPLNLRHSFWVAASRFRHRQFEYIFLLKSSSFHFGCTMGQGRIQKVELGGKLGNQGVWRTEVPQWVQGQSPGRGSGGWSPPEAEAFFYN